MLRHPHPPVRKARVELAAFRFFRPTAPPLSYLPVAAIAQHNKQSQKDGSARRGLTVKAWTTSP